MVYLYNVNSLLITRYSLLITHYSEYKHPAQHRDKGRDTAYLKSLVTHEGNSKETYLIRVLKLEQRKLLVA